MSASSPQVSVEDQFEEIDSGDIARRYLWLLPLIRLSSIALAVGSWEFIGREVAPLFMSYPSAILVAALSLIRTGELEAAFLQSLVILLAGFVIASLIGIGLGLLIGRYRPIEAATDWAINALYATPLVALMPLVILWFGLGASAKLFIVAILTVFPVLINTVSGVRNVPTLMMDVGNAFAANERQIFSKIILPSALPYMMTGLRLGIGRAIIGMVVAEFFTALTGLGGMIVKYGNQYKTAAMFVPIFVLMLLGIVITALVRHIEDRIAPWRQYEDND